MIQQARIRKTKYFFEARDYFMADLKADIEKGIKMAEKLGLTPVFRLNGTSDLAFEKYTINENNLFELFPDVQFYDYTKVLGRKVSKYKNYHLTFSAADGNDADVAEAIKQGMNVAMVFDKLPESYMGREVINADEHDLRFLDKQGVIAGLKAKGKGKKDTTGFVRRVVDIQAVWDYNTTSTAKRSDYVTKSYRCFHVHSASMDPAFSYANGNHSGWRNELKTV